MLIVLAVNSDEVYSIYDGESMKVHGHLDLPDLSTEIKKGITFFKIMP